MLDFPGGSGSENAAASASDTGSGTETPDGPLLHAYSRTVSEVVEKIAPSVVRLDVRRGQRLRDTLHFAEAVVHQVQEPMQ